MSGRVNVSANEIASVSDENLPRPIFRAIFICTRACDHEIILYIHIHINRYCVINTTL